MGKFDLKERTLSFAERILNICEQLPHTIECNVIRKQLIKSGTSIGANVEEADGSESKADTAHKLGIARKEARETRYWLTLISRKYLGSEVVSDTINESSEFIKIFSTIINKLK